MTDEERLQMITEQLLIVRDNLFRGLSKSMQKLQAKSINEVLELPNFTESPQRTEQNFCSRCGKRTADFTHIHTCTPPQD
jgi:hypothetical protein